MKVLLTLLVFAVAFVAPSFGQDQAAIAAAQSECGPNEPKFDVKEDATQHPTPQPGADNALVYVVEDAGSPNRKGSALLRVGMDGAWVGANTASTYFFFVAVPGEHHLCVNWQSRLRFNRFFAMANFTAEAGRVYYFRSRLFSASNFYFFDLEPVNSDQGKYLVASSAFSVSYPKK